jgi:ribokinase
VTAASVLNGRIVVVGRANVDLTVRVPHLPLPGRTVFGSPLATSPGGKALNQAIAMARLGAHVDLIANVGADAWGEYLRDTVVAAGVGHASFHRLPDTATGAAIIEVTPEGEPHIVLAPSPATELSTDDVVRGLANAPPSVVVTQLDLPPAAIAGIWQVPRPQLLIGNLVPHRDLDRKVLAQLDVFVVNTHEAAAILEVDRIEASAAAQALQDIGPQIAVVTAGGLGAAYSGPDGNGTVAAPAVDVVDTSGAGDAFLAALTVALARGIPLAEATRLAVEAGSRAVQRHGATAVDNELPI